jgi:hypothetical protein
MATKKKAKKKTTKLGPLMRAPRVLWITFYPDESPHMAHGTKSAAKKALADFPADYGEEGLLAGPYVLAERVRNR